MPQGQIRKGFFFYFGLFVLFGLAVFCVCLVVMMFNPGKTVLWMQYFTANETIHISKTTDEAQTEIDYSNLENIKVECSSFANVSVQKTKDFNKSGVYIVNKAKGFVGASGVQHFQYTVELESLNKTLKITVQEPNGFLYLSKEVNVVLNVFSEDSAFSYQNVNLTVKTVDGTVNIGETGKAVGDVSLKSFNVETVSSNINILSHFNMDNLQNVSSTVAGVKLKTVSGNIVFYNQVVYGTNQEGNGLNVNCNVELSNQKGRIIAQAVTCNNLEIKSEKGDVKIDYIKTSTGSDYNTKITCSKGNFVFGNVFSNVSFTRSEDMMLSPNVTISNLEGNFLISGADDANPDINIKKISGKFGYILNQGKIKLGEANGEIAIDSIGNLSVDVVVGKTNSASKIIKNKSGNIRVGFLQDVFGNNKFETVNGQINIDVVKNAKFVATTMKSDGTTKLEDNKIEVNLGSSVVGMLTKNPLVVNNATESDGKIDAVTDNKIVFTNKTEAQIKANEVA